MATKRELAQKQKDLESAQRAFDALRSAEKALIVDALHGEWNKDREDSAHWRWDAALERFRRDVEDGRAKVAKFAQRIAEHQNPAHEMEWADSAFQAAAEIEVALHALAWLAAKGPDATVRELNQRLRHTAGPGRSSSESHRSIQAFRAEALVKAIEALGWL